MYTEKVIERFKNPRHAGVIEGADGIGEEGNLRCGDIMKIYLTVKDNIIKDVKFQTYGCVAAIVSSDALCEAAIGKTIEEASKMTNKDIIAVTGEMPPVKHHCSILGAEALHRAIADYKKKHPK